MGKGLNWRLVNGENLILQNRNRFEEKTNLDLPSSFTLLGAEERVGRWGFSSQRNFTG